ncbi:endo-a1,5-arabinanase [Asticcacaulis biprosthecium C19]|uniref:Extracellular exo-alpha-(1->5)-L-arabinofuranosidase n=1 Tax=Asticcacaulis biprosthecium C19 TaxID=715226 RepID=F4QI21_9CAUL|nr:arabinan endo-1,5-alpha-L-arabinosidase [Asticcacaulis biprosthecium]EGF92888.1 endo-a1,5-arabinanase [Asticcacaulis biprosthecium C19]
MLTKRQMLGGVVGLGLIGPATRAKDLSGDLAPVHDPCIIKDKAVYHLFSTSQLREGGLIVWRTSPDMVTWTLKGHVLREFPKWVTDAVPGTRGAWAPDIAFVNGRFHLYYSASTFGSNRSVIGLLTSPTLDTSDPAFGWKDEGLVVESDAHNRYNAIDSNYLIAADGKHWISFGSFWSGIQLHEADPKTGKPKNRLKKPKNIASRPMPGAVEAPVIIRRGALYYLFASYDFCCKGVDSTYYTVVGRSAGVDGPYIDDTGAKLLDGGGRTVLQADDRWKGPGHCAVFEDEGVHYIVYHAYDGQAGGRPTLRIQALNWTEDGWPTV